MNEGLIAIYGDVVGYSMRGGRIYVRGRIEDQRLGFGALISELNEETKKS